MIKAIVCTDLNFGIGKNKGLLFNLKTDFEWFKKNTFNHVVVLGYNTLLSLPGSKPLKNRLNIVLCPPGKTVPGCLCYYDFNELLDFLIPFSKEQDVWIIGGGMFYASMLPYCEKVYLTQVETVDTEATVFFPNISVNPAFKCIFNGPLQEENNYKFRFKIYEKTAHKIKRSK